MSGKSTPGTQGLALPFADVPLCSLRHHTSCVTQPALGVPLLSEGNIHHSWQEFLVLAAPPFRAGAVSGGDSGTSGAG